MLTPTLPPSEGRHRRHRHHQHRRAGMLAANFRWQPRIGRCRMFSCGFGGPIGCIAIGDSSAGDALVPRIAWCSAPAWQRQRHGCQSAGSWYSMAVGTCLALVTEHAYGVKHPMRWFFLGSSSRAPVGSNQHRPRFTHIDAMGQPPRCRWVDTPTATDMVPPVLHKRATVRSCNHALLRATTTFVCNRWTHKQLIMVAAEPSHPSAE